MLSYLRILPLINSTNTDVAYASEAIEMRDINNADFRFAKTLTLPFFGSGMVDLPPGGEKRVKNSRKMQMVFFVFYGRVTVDLGTPMQRFGIGKGGMWQVPRGEFLHLAFVRSVPSLSSPSSSPGSILPKAFLIINRELLFHRQQLQNQARSHLLRPGLRGRGRAKRG